MSFITGTADTDRVLSLYITPSAFENGLRVCRSWSQALQSPNFLPNYASSLSSDKMKDVSPIIFKKFLLHLSVEQVFHLDQKKVKRILLNKICETPENKAVLCAAKLIISLHDLKSTSMPKFSFEYLTKLEYFLKKRAWESVRFGEQQPIPNENPPVFLIEDWNNLRTLDKEQLHKVLKMEFACYYILHFGPLGSISLPTTLFKAYCSSLEIRKNVPKEEHYIFVRNNKQLSVLGECIKSTTSSFYHIALFIDEKVSVEGIQLFNQKLVEIKCIPKFFFSSPRPEQQAEVQAMLKSMRANCLGIDGKPLTFGQTQ